MERKMLQTLKQPESGCLRLDPTNTVWLHPDIAAAHDFFVSASGFRPVGLHHGRTAKSARSVVNKDLKHTGGRPSSAMPAPRVGLRGGAVGDSRSGVGVAAHLGAASPPEAAAQILW